MERITALTEEGIRLCLQNHPWREQIVVLDTVDSTNTLAKKLAAQGAPHGTVVLADEQTAGRGRLGRNFVSTKGLGLYCSVILRCPVLPQQLFHLTTMAAVAAMHAMEHACGLKTQIKWINDLVVGGKKICGILTELAVEQNGNAEYAVIGVGINCGQLPGDFPPDVAAMATSVYQQTHKIPQRSELAAELIRQLHRVGEEWKTDPQPWMQEYRDNCITVGQNVQLIHNGCVREALAVGLGHSGALVVQLRDGTMETVFSGEVSVRGMYGYL